MALDQIDFQFRKIKEEELIIADSFRDSLEKTIHLNTLNIEGRRMCTYET